MNRFLENIISIPLWLLIAPAVMTLAHWSMVKTSFEVKKLKKATYKELKEKMLSVNWEFDPNHPCSLFDSNRFYENYFHASVFRFGDVGYLLTPFGLLMANILQRKIRKSLPTYHFKPYIK